MLNYFKWRIDGRKERCRFVNSDIIFGFNEKLSSIIDMAFQIIIIEEHVNYAFLKEWQRQSYDSSFF